MQTKILAIAGVCVTGGLGGFFYWYSLPRNVKESLMKEGSEPLSTEEGKDKEEWKKIAKKYAGATPNPKLGNLVITISGNVEATDQDIKNLQSECAKLFKQKKGENGYEDSLTKARDWCIKNSKKLG